MTFPTSPTNGQQHTEGIDTYIYRSAETAWELVKLIKERLTYEQSASAPNAILTTHAAAQSSDWTTIRGNSASFDVVTLTYDTSDVDLTAGNDFVIVNNAVDVRVDAEVVIWGLTGGPANSYIAQIVDTVNNLVLAKASGVIPDNNMGTTIPLSYTGPVAAGGRIEVRHCSVNNGNGYRTSATSFDIQVL